MKADPDQGLAYILENNQSAHNNQPPPYQRSVDDKIN